MRLILISLVILSLSACGPLEKEKVNPVAKVQTLADMLGSGKSPTIELTFKFQDINVEPPIRRIPIPIIGTIVSELGNTLAEVFILLNQAWGVKQEPLFLIYHQLIQIHFAH